MARQTKKLRPDSRPIFWPRSQKRVKRRRKSPRSPARCATNPSRRRSTKNWRESREILDIVGTGGDRLGTFNISTTAAILCAAAGVTVAKHGNRAVTSQAGSADVLEALGIQIDLTPEEAARSLRERHFAFFFAPNYHPAFKNISIPRENSAPNAASGRFSTCSARC
jgi:anthranilate phosphoribosyltransferase